MIEPTLTGWNPERELARLLDALTEELLTAPDHELAASHHDADNDQHDGAEPVRRIIAAADAGFVALPVSTFVAPGLRAFLTRNQ